MLRVLTYHRVSEPGLSRQLDPRLISATPSVFRQQMRHLAQHYRVLSVEEVLQAVRCRERLPARAVLITFDDAYRDFGEIAWPVLRRYKLPVTLFVPTAYPENRRLCFWWDRLHRAIQGAGRPELTISAGSFPLQDEQRLSDSRKRLSKLIKELPHRQALALLEEICQQSGADQQCDNHVHSWEELRQLSSEGVTLAAHTRTHPILTRLPAQDLAGEIGGSQQDLQRRIGKALPVFSYPDGGYDRQVMQVVEEQGFEMAFTTRDRRNHLQGRSRCLLEMGRTNITRRTTASIFRLRLWPPFVYLDAWRHGQWGTAR